MHLKSIGAHATSYCNRRLHAATHCNALHYTVIHCNTLQHTATHCNTQNAPHCNSLQHTATHCNTLQRCIYAQAQKATYADGEAGDFEKMATYLKSIAPHAVIFDTTAAEPVSNMCATRILTITHTHTHTHTHTNMCVFVVDFRHGCCEPVSNMCVCLCVCLCVS